VARFKEELKRIHGKKVRKAKTQVRQYYQGQLSYEKLNALAKKFLKKRKSKEKKPA
jgi:hypothetical protein